MSRPRIFIGSSTKGLDVAYAVQQNLDHFAEITVWAQGVFELQKPIITNIINALDRFDFAIFVFRPEDPISQRGIDGKTVRDNVIYEAGLFAGRLGFERVFFLKPRGVDDLMLPTDLLGVVPGEYDPDRDDDSLWAATGPFCQQVRKAIEQILEKSTQKATTTSDNGIKVYTDTNTAFSDLRLRIVDQNLKALHADIIQHSSERAFTIISALANDSASLNIYLQHPNTINMLCRDVQSRIDHRLRRYPEELNDMGYEGPLEVYLYYSPATLNGICVTLQNNTKLLLLSWYTYLCGDVPDDLLTYRINGSENPCIEISSNNPRFKYFERYFKQMLNNYKRQGNIPLYALPRDKDLSNNEWERRVSKTVQ